MRQVPKFKTLIIDFVLMQKKIQHSIENSVSATLQLKEAHGLAFIENASLMIAQCFREGNKIIIAGNGGSLCDAIHFAEELTGFFRSSRPALPAIALAEAGHITCVANDVGFESVFARGVEAYGKPGDIFIGLTTSGNSPNIIKAFETAIAKGLKTIAFLGKGGGKLHEVADCELIIKEFTTSDRIQEAHMVALHIIVEVVEELLFSENAQLSTKEGTLLTEVSHSRDD